MPVASKKNKSKRNGQAVTTNSANRTASNALNNKVENVEEPIVLPNNGKPKLFIVFYTTYLHIYKLALEIKKGAEKTGSCDVYLFQIPETLDDAVLKKVRAPPKPDVPLITTDLLKQADGIMFGFPTRYGILPAQLKEFIDSCGKLWANGELAGKMAGTFVSSATQHGGQETSILTFLTVLAHFGIIYVPFGYGSPHLSNDKEVLGGSPWGASVIAGKDGTRQPSALELEIGKLQGEIFAKTLSRYNIMRFRAPNEIINDVKLNDNLSETNNKELKINLDGKDSTKSKGLSNQAKVGLASGAVAAATGILVNEAIPRNNNHQASGDDNFNNAMMAIPADMDSSRGVVTDEKPYPNLEPDTTIEKSPLLTDKGNYLDSVATSDASALLLQNSKEKDDFYNEYGRTVDDESPIIASRNEVKPESEMTKNRAALTSEVLGYGEHDRSSPLVLSEENPLDHNITNQPSTSILTATGNLKQITTENLGSDNVVLGPGGNAGDNFALENNKNINKRLDDMTTIEDLSKSKDKRVGMMATAATAGTISATAAAIAASKSSNKEDSPQPRVTQEQLSQLYLDSTTKMSNQENTVTTYTKPKIAGIPMDIETAGAASSTSGQIVDFHAISKRQIESINVLSEDKNALSPLKIDKDSSMSPSVSTPTKSEKGGSRRSSSVLASAALTAASALATGIFASKASKKHKEKKAQHENESGVISGHEDINTLESHQTVDKSVSAAAAPTAIAAGNSISNGDTPKVVVTSSTNEKDLDRSPLQSPSPVAPTTPDIEARGRKASHAFNSTEAVLNPVAATAGVTAATGLVGSQIVNHDDPTMTNGEGNLIKDTYSQESNPLPKTANEVQTKPSHGSGIMEMPLPVTATQASSQLPDFGSVKEKNSYDTKTNRSKNSQISSGKSSTSNLKKLFNRLSFRKKDNLMNDDM